MHRLLLVCLACVALAPVGHAQTGVSNLANSPLGFVYRYENMFFAQSFVTDASAPSFHLTAVTLPIFYGSGISDFTVQIRNNASNIPGSLLGSLTGTTSPTTAEYDFVNGSMLLEASTTYWVTWGFTTAAGGGFASPQITGYASTGAWTLGNMTTSYNHGANWYTPNPGYTMQISVQASAVPEPATYAALCGAAGLALAVWRKRRRA